MILVKRLHLYMLTTLMGMLLILGELRFFFALKSANLSENLQMKYEIESFIFASIVFTLIVILFLIFFLHRSVKILKALDKMIDISQYGEHDIASHLKRLGPLGEKIASLLLHFKKLNDMKSLKISSLSGIVAIVIEKNEALIFLVNRHGNIVNCSDQLLKLFGLAKEQVIKGEVRALFQDMNYEEIFFDLEKSRDAITKEGMTARIPGNTSIYKVHLYPVTNADAQISHIVGIIEE
ncbi:MAG: PAS domain-containing protein [Candidatus Omnitrophota bacterium]